MPTGDVEHDTPPGKSRAGRPPGMIIGATLVGLFGGLTVWGLLGDEQADATPPTAVSAVDGSPREQSGSRGEVAVVMNGVHEPPPSQLLMPPRKIGALLNQQFKHQGATGSTALTPLRNVLGADGGIVVINVWATYCEPCKREFPGFRELQRGWGEDVRFVPVQLGDDGVGQLKAVMPDALDQLIDFMPGGTVQTALHDLGLLPPKATIPVTLALDCKRHLRWVHEGEVKDMTRLNAVVQELRQELRSSYCAVPLVSRTPGALEMPVETAAQAGAGRAAQLASPCKGGCPVGQECKMQSSGGYICRLPLQ